MTLEVILRAVFGVRAESGSSAARVLGGLLTLDRAARMQLLVLLASRFGAPRTAEPASTLTAARSTRCCWPRSPSAAPRAPGDDICSLLVGARFEDGGDDDREIRDQ